MIEVSAAGYSPRNIPANSSIGEILENFRAIQRMYRNPQPRFLWRADLTAELSQLLLPVGFYKQFGDVIVGHERSQYHQGEAFPVIFLSSTVPQEQRFLMFSAKLTENYNFLTIDSSQDLVIVSGKDRIYSLSLTSGAIHDKVQPPHEAGSLPPISFPEQIWSRNACVAGDYLLVVLHMQSMQQKAPRAWAYAFSGEEMFGLYRWTTGVTIKVLCCAAIQKCISLMIDSPLDLGTSAKT